MGQHQLNLSCRDRGAHNDASSIPVNSENVSCDEVKRPQRKEIGSTLMQHFMQEFSHICKLPEIRSGGTQVHRTYYR